MSYKFTPRGIMKWAPFTALTEQDDHLSRLYENVDKLSLIEIDEQKKDIINYEITQAQELKTQVYCVSLLNGKSIITEGYIGKVDELSLEIEGINILKKNIYDLYNKGSYNEWFN